MVKTIIAIYPGRFQPMGKHHYDAYKWLSKKFGADNTYIATSDKVDPPKSPLNFKEKKEVASKYGIGDKIIQVKNPYKAEEITSKYDSKTTAVVFMVGQKDMQEDPRFRIGKKKDGGDSYFQKYEPNKPMKPYTEHGYLAVAPHMSYNIDGVGEMSGTNIRKALSNPDLTSDQFKDIFGWYDKKIQDMLYSKFTGNEKKDKPIYEIIEERAILNTLLRSLLTEGGKIFDGTQRIKLADIDKTIDWLEDKSGLSLKDKMLGSTGRKADSGDLDLGVDKKEISPNDLISKLSSNGIEKSDIKKSGTNVHVKTPIAGDPNNGFVQTDFMFNDDVEFMKFSMKGGEKDGPYKGVHKHLVLSSIAKAQGYKWSYLNGLMDRSTNKTISKNPDEIAKKIIGDDAKKEDLVSVESIIKAIKNKPQYEEWIAQARQDLEKDGLELPKKEDLKEVLEKLLTLNKLFEAASARIQHPEDLIYWDGSKGAERALRIMDTAAKDPSTTSVKWDGSPAVVFGVDDSGNFILTDKSGFTAKGYDGKAKSAKEIETMFKNRAIKSSEKSGAKPDFTFAKSMANAYEVFKKSWPKGLTGYFKGDLLYQSKPEIVDGEYVFKPNITTYKIPVNSDLGKQITKSEVGVIPHVYQTLDGKESGVKDANQYKFNSAGGLMVFSPVFPKSGAKIDSKLMSAAKLAVSSAKSADKLLDKSKLSQEKMSDYADMLYKFTNSKAASMNTLSAKEFINFLQKENTISDGKKAKMIDYSEKNKSDLEKVFNSVKAINNLKNSIIAQLDSQDMGVKASIGDQAGGEGYVISDPSGPVKLVNRGGFTAANRANQR
jgi:hypothetical protein